MPEQPNNTVLKDYLEYNDWERIDLLDTLALQVYNSKSKVSMFGDPPKTEYKCVSYNGDTLVLENWNYEGECVATDSLKRLILQNYK